MQENQIYKWTGSEIAHAVNGAEVSVKEVVERFSSRTEAIEPSVSAWASFDPQYVVTQAERVAKSGKSYLLGGVPIGIKDVFNTEHYPTEKGSASWKGYRAGNDARCVSYLRDHGSVIFGKTDTAELAVHANVKARNPHDLSRVTGSSSSGSAAAVASAMVPVALGTQTGGSTIRPGSWCGVYAMKPSFGLIPRTGVLKTTDTLDTIGCFARCVDDLGILLEALRVKGDNFPIQERELKSRSESIPSKWKIAFCRSHLDDFTETYVSAALLQFQHDLSSMRDIEVVTLELPAPTKRFQQLHRRIYHPCLAYYLKTELRQSPDEVSQTLKDIFADALTIPPEDYAVALREQSVLSSEISRFFVDNEVDLIISNSSNGSAPIEEPDRHLDLNQLWTMTWLPVSNAPAFSCPNGLPFGLQTIGPRYSDFKMLTFLKLLEQRELIPARSKIAEPKVRGNDSNVVSF